MIDPLYSPHLAAIDLYLFETMLCLGGQKFQTYDEHKINVLNWLHSQERTFYAAVINSLPG